MGAKEEGRRFVDYRVCRHSYKVFRSYSVQFIRSKVVNDKDNKKVILLSLVARSRDQLSVIYILFNCIILIATEMIMQVR